MRKTYQQLQSAINMDTLVDGLRQALLKLPDPRARSVKYSFHDIVMCGYAIFHLKSPSLLQFEDRTVVEQHNLQTLFHIKDVCEDSHLRNILDQIDPKSLRKLYQNGIDLLRKVGVIKSYRLPSGHLICSIDGVHYYSSQKVKCDCCCERQHGNGKITYSHAMLAAALIHPNEKEVFIMDTEPIVKQDGATKNDCELNANSRLFDQLEKNYTKDKLLIAQDALYAVGPQIRRILGNKWDFVVNIKPDKHKNLYKLFETRRQYKAVKYHEERDKDGTIHRFWYANDLPLNNSATDVRVNMLQYEEEKSNGKIQKFCWATSLKLHARSLQRIMRIGRSRWKIENETFNTLKTKGYQFDHNFGHGTRHLSNFLAMLMCLAFQIDQIFERCNKRFQRILKKSKTKIKVWSVVRSVYMTTFLYSFNELYSKVELLFNSA